MRNVCSREQLCLCEITAKCLLLHEIWYILWLFPWIIFIASFYLFKKQISILLCSSNMAVIALSWTSPTVSCPVVFCFTSLCCWLYLFGMLFGLGCCEMSSPAQHKPIVRGPQRRWLVWHRDHYWRSLQTQMPCPGFLPAALGKGLVSCHRSMLLVMFGRKTPGRSMEKTENLQAR